MSTGAILGIIMIVGFALLIARESAKASGREAARTEFTKDYGEITAYKQAAIEKINTEKAAFEKNKQDILENMLIEASRLALEKEKDVIRNLHEKCNIDISLKQAELKLKLGEITKEIEKSSAIHGDIIQASNEFKSGVLSCRKWLSKYLSDLTAAKHELSLQDKTRAPRTTEKYTTLKKEHKILLEKYFFLEMQLSSYKEYFPFLEEYEELILDERIDIGSLSNGSDENIDRASIFLSKEEYAALPSTEKYQLALERYFQRPKSNWEIGRCYERYLGYLYEKEGWDVTYFGATKKFEDMGRDLICKKPGKVHIVQAKCWSKDKIIHEKHLFQLFGTTLSYELEMKTKETITPVFVATTSLSDVASRAAMRLGIIVKNEPLSKEYPCIKCNISTSNNEKIYHLPFDQQYDKIKIDRKDECYVATVAEAETKGFRRAKRFIGMGGKN